MAIETSIRGPYLDNTLELLRQLVQEPLKFRETRAENSPYALYYDQPTGGVTGNTQYLIEQAQSGSERFSALFISFEQTSGAGRYMVTASPPMSPTIGFPIPTGASFIVIEGHQDIKNFKMMAEAGQTLLFSRVLFR
jgi:hypothetical protein